MTAYGIISNEKVYITSDEKAYGVTHKPGSTTHQPYFKKKKKSSKI
jgi:hypothetical protein